MYSNLDGPVREAVSMGLLGSRTRVAPSSSNEKLDALRDNRPMETTCHLETNRPMEATRPMGDACHLDQLRHWRPTDPWRLLA
jgi:hypothetical protein